MEASDPGLKRYPHCDQEGSQRRMLLALKRLPKVLSLSGHLHTFRYTFVSTALMKGNPRGQCPRLGRAC